MKKNKREVNFELIENCDLRNLNTLMDDIYSKKIDGVVIKDALSSSMVDEILKSLSTIDAEKYVNMKEGYYSFPKPFSYVDLNENLFEDSISTLCNEWNWLKQNSINLFSVDLIQEFVKIFSKITNANNVEIPKGYNGKGSYSPYTFRILSPNIGKFLLHVGNQFNITHSKLYDDLTTKVEVHNQLSFFFMINPPDKGGELTVYDIEWDNVKKRVDDFTLEDIDGNIIHVDDRKKESFGLNKGDLLIFCGGELWHRVEPVYGNKNRITLGGFLGYSKDKSTLFFWS
jgi:hypothetical protein